MFGKFSDVKYERPDLEAVKAGIAKYMEDFKSAKTYEEAKKFFLDYQHSTEHLETMAEIASVRNTIDKTDEFYDAEMNFYNEELPEFGPITKAADELLLNSPFRAEFEKEYGSLFIKNMEMGQKLTSKAIIPNQIEEAKLCQDYAKAVAVCTTDFHGENCNFYGLLKHMQSTDRAIRKEAFEAWAKMYAEVAPELDEIYSKLTKVRLELANKLGFDSYIDYVYLEKQRYDYKPCDIKNFREAVKKYITPLCRELAEKQKERLGVDEFHYYDEALLFPEGNENPVGTMPEMVQKAKQMYREMSKETGEFFDFMTEHDLFDLESKPGKHMGGYCTFFNELRAPFIFSNFNGTSADVDVLTHEAGHAFEAYAASHNLPLLSMAWSTSEINEIHAMSMEYFAYPWMENFFENADKYRYLHLTDSLRVIPYMVAVDEFQHRVFEKPDMTAEERYAVWHELEQYYLPWRDYDGNEFLEKGGFWMQKQHIFLYPFYYIEYALAQMCTFMYYQKMQEDRAAAWKDYYNLCCAGGSKGYFELLEIGGLKNPFHEENIKSIADMIRAKLL